MTLTAPTDELLRTDEVADRLRVSIRTVWRLIERGELPAVKVGAQWRIPADELNDQLVPPRRAQQRSTANGKAA